MNRRSVPTVKRASRVAPVASSRPQAQPSTATSALAASFRGITAVSATSTPVETADLFDRTYTDRNLSPIDQYIENTNALNRLYLGEQVMSPEMGSLVLLGYVSAVESFFRALFRGLINADDFAARLAEPLAVPFGAALHLEKKMLPEAVIEEYSFASSQNVKEAIRALAGIKGGLPNDVDIALREFQKVCEMRHCCVHRFGKLGAKNAIKLGLQSHRDILEKPLKLDQVSLEKVGVGLRGFVKIINNYVFAALMERLVSNKVEGHWAPPYSGEWTWRWRSDKARFVKYYILFASVLDAVPSAPSKDVYESLRIYAQDRRVGGRGRGQTTRA